MNRLIDRCMDAEEVGRGGGGEIERAIASNFVFGILTCFALLSPSITSLIVTLLVLALSRLNRVV